MMALLSGMKVKMPDSPVVAGKQFKSTSALTRRIPSLFTASQALCSLPRFASYRASSFDAWQEPQHNWPDSVYILRSVFYQ